MIISASRRTDIPSFYAAWLHNRLRAGQVLVPYPRDPGRLASITLTPENVDCLILWTKNPAPLLDRLAAIDGLGFRYYFSFTLTGYGPALERHLPPKKQLVETFLRLSERLGPERVDWRFDPIWLHGDYSPAWHLEAFGALCRQLQGATTRCIINFVKPYRHLPQIRQMEEGPLRETARGLAAIAWEYRIPLVHCSGSHAFSDLGLTAGACIDREKIEQICGYPIIAKKDPGQPTLCRCLQSIDIGIYDTCANGCSYCYANTGAATLQRQRANHDPASPLLSGWPQGRPIRDRSGPTLRDPQPRLF